MIQQKAMGATYWGKTNDLTIFAGEEKNFNPFCVIEVADVIRAAKNANAGYRGDVLAC